MGGYVALAFGIAVAAFCGLLWRLGEDTTRIVIFAVIGLVALAILVRGYIKHIEYETNKMRLGYRPRRGGDFLNRDGITPGARRLPPVPQRASETAATQRVH